MSRLWALWDLGWKALDKVKSGLWSAAAVFGQSTWIESVESFGRQTLGLQTRDDVRANIKQQASIDKVNEVNKQIDKTLGGWSKVATDIFIKNLSPEVVSQLEGRSIEDLITTADTENFFKNVDSHFKKWWNDLSDYEKTIYTNQKEYRATSYLNMMRQTLDTEWFDNWLSENQWANDRINSRSNMQYWSKKTHGYDFASWLVRNLFEPLDHALTQASLTDKTEEEQQVIIRKYGQDYWYAWLMDPNVKLTGKDLAKTYYSEWGWWMDAIPALGIVKDIWGKFINAGKFTKSVNRLINTASDIPLVKKSIINNIKNDAALTRYLKENKIGVNVKNFDKIVAKVNEHSQHGRAFIGILWDSWLDVTKGTIWFGKRRADVMWLDSQLAADIKVNAVGWLGNYIVKEWSRIPAELLSLDKWSMKYLTKTHTVGMVWAAMWDNGAIGNLAIVGTVVGAWQDHNEAYMNEDSVAKKIVDAQYIKAGRDIPGFGDPWYDDYKNVVREQHSYLTPTQMMFDWNPDSSFGVRASAIINGAMQIGATKVWVWVVKLWWQITWADKITDRGKRKLLAGNFLDKDGNLNIEALKVIDETIIYCWSA